MWERSCFNIRLMVSLVLIGTCLIVRPAQARYSGGTGEPNDPYQIATAEDLNDIANHPDDFDKHFVMVNDVDLASYTGTQFNIIGTSHNSFTGVFDGNGHYVVNFSYTSAGRNYIGIFGYLAGEGQIKNLGVVDCSINAGDGDYVGGLLGRNNNSGKVYNCFATGSISGDRYVGGLVGYNSERISNCYSMAEVSGTQYVGGLVGCNYDLVTRCYSTGHITGSLNTGG